MADQEQLAILGQGVEVWNAWRKEHLGIMLDFEHADLQGADLSEIDLSEVDLQGNGIIGDQTERANLQRANLQRANLQRVNLYRANLQRVNLYRANLQQANLQRANLYRANLRWADLSGADLSEANLRWADLSGANLQDVDLSWADLQGANLLGANLQRAYPQGANLTRANLTRAKFQGGNLEGANLSGANLSGANMQESIISGTVFVDVDLRDVQGLDMVGHIGPSSIGIDTLYRSQGDIPEVFLRGCGVPDPMIEYARSLVAAQHPIDYYSVFISYSSYDEAVAKRLHTDLQARGVRCWFAPHDLPIGTPIAGGIDEAIRIYDKLLIILSEASVKSNWVAFEVSTALHREVEQGRTMLFPIRLDDTVLYTPSGWAAQLRSRHIGDFQGWKDHERYQAALARLLRDLVADTHAKE